MFARRHLLVELAPYFYGHEPSVLDLVVDRALSDPEVVPLVGVAGARDRMYSLASVLARETAIADSLARQLARSDAPTVDSSIVQAEITAAEERIGGRLSDGQREAAVAICTSGRGAELVVGVAGSGKTTMLAVVTAAFEHTGHRVIGTATSGQAARTLGTEASIGESRTLTSLVWRLDHDQLTLDDRTVVILDEVGMTDDVDLIRLTGYVEASGAKLVLVGDDRQLGPVGPGGALGALVSRHPGAVHDLVENRRQSDPDERRALEELRAGNITKALCWYANNERIHAVADRHDALDAAVDAWAADMVAGHQTGLYAWRRANVAELNNRARHWMHHTGRLAGPELECGGGNVFQAGDQVIALAPNHQAGLVTSQRATVDAVDPQAGTIILRCGDGELVCLSGVEAAADRLGYGYATTVHRAQGATTDRAHLFADGGGRELAYVAMSRARTASDVWVVADDLDQAVDDLHTDWSTQKRPVWAIDTGLPDTTSTTREELAALPDDQKARIMSLAAARCQLTAQGLDGVHGSDLAPAIHDLTTTLDQTRQAKADLAAGTGSYHDTDAGLALRDLREARARLQQATHLAEKGDRRRDRRTAAHEAERWANAAADAQRRCNDYVALEAARLDNQLLRHQEALDRLQRRQDDRRRAEERVHQRALIANRTASRLSKTLNDNVRARLDGVGRAKASPTSGRQVRVYQPATEPLEPTRRVGPDL